MTITFALLFFLSSCLNLYLYTRTKKPTKKVESLELRQFLADLLSGPAMIAVARVDPDYIQMRSPRAQ